MKQTTSITIPVETREQLRQLQKEYTLEVDDVLRLLLFVYDSVGKDYQVVITNQDGEGRSHSIPSFPMNGETQFSNWKKE